MDRLSAAGLDERALAFNPQDGYQAGMDIPRFHLAFPVRDLAEARAFYLTLEQWEAMAQRLKAGGVEFVIAPQVRFKGQPGEQATMFFLDPSGNALEFKAFADDAMVFAR